MPYKPLQTPLYQRVFGVLHERIQHGVYPVGSALSTEDRLAEEFGVSKATVRQAVGELVDRGIVVRQQGKGTFVCPGAGLRPARQFIGSMNDLITGIRDLPLRDRSVEHDVTFPADVRAQLSMPESNGTVVRVVREVEGIAFALVIQYLPTSVAGDITLDELNSAGPIDILHGRGIHISTARQTIAAELADVEVAENLDVELGAAVLFAERVVHSDDGPVQLVRTWYRGDLYRWEAQVEYVWSADGTRLSILNENN
jgi:GntR family transcriptional regulator